MIVMLEGLEYNQELEELFISHQQTSEELKFDMTSLAVISNTLQVLEADGNRITNVSPLAYLSISPFIPFLILLKITSELFH